MIGGDLQARTARALETARVITGTEYDAWLEMFTATRCLYSVGDQDVTYTAGAGGPTSAIDHWLVSAALFEHSDTEVGAGAGGLHSGDTGKQDDEAIGGAPQTHGHNSLQIVIRLQTEAAEEAAEEEWAAREMQLKPMDKEEWEVLQERGTGGSGSGG